MAPTVNKDVEETRRLAKEAHKQDLADCEILCVAMMHTAANGNPVEIMSLLDMISSRVILQTATDLKMSTNNIVGLHFQHIVKTIKVLKGDNK